MWDIIGMMIIFFIISMPIVYYMFKSVLIR
jgi:hypothetical protein